jgi:hypothetical protein
MSADWHQTGCGAGNGCHAANRWARLLQICCQPRSASTVCATKREPPCDYRSQRLNTEQCFSH